MDTRRSTVAALLVAVLAPAGALSQVNPSDNPKNEVPEGELQKPAATGPDAQAQPATGQVPEKESPFDPGDDLAGAYVQSAQTMPKGNMSFRSRQVALLEFNWAVHDRAQLTAGMTFPVMQVAFLLGAKYKLVDEPRFKLAALASFGTGVMYVGPDIFGVGGGPSLLGDVCMGKGCKSYVSFGTQFLTAYVTDDYDSSYDRRDNWTVFIINSRAGVVGAISKKVKLLFGIGHVAATCKDSEHWLNVFYADYGIRFHGDHFGVDLLLVRPFMRVWHGEAYSVEEGMKYLPIGYPFLSLTYQWN